MAARDWQTAVRHTHSLKGVARTLGAIDLSEAAAALMPALEHQDVERCSRLLPPLQERLRLMVGGLEELECIQANGDGPVAGGAENLPDNRARLVRLADLIANRDTEAVELVLDITPCFASGRRRLAWAEIVRLIDSYDFEAAGEKLAALMQILGNTESNQLE
jgi:HPt (histidine-containing phosphotransfer) domain-containing protein